MPKAIELPPAVARRFIVDMRAFYAEKNPIKRDEIAGGRCTSLGIIKDRERSRYASRTLRKCFYG
jgi:hypothetical protein